MQYPLKLSFKIAAFAPQLFVRDAAGAELLYVKQKLMSLKDKVTVFADSGQSRPLYEINADRIMDYNARFTFTDTGGRVLGSVKRQGAQSLWKATYEIFTADDRPLAVTVEENPWVKVLDALLMEVPFVNLFHGYFLNPKYLVTDSTSQRPLLRVIKSKAFFESKFEVERLDGPPDEAAETTILLSILMMVLHERRRK
jgi:uncharacterized protein YxjI